MQELLTFILSNYPLTFFILSILFAIIALAIKPKPLMKEEVIEILFSYFLLFNIGFSFLYSFISHVFFGDIAAEFIGWKQSPFQLEVGFACLGFAALGIIGFCANIGFRAATVIATALFSWGAAAGHIYQMVVAHNYAPGNAGIMFWTDVLLPILGFILLWLQYKNPNSRVVKK